MRSDSTCSAQRLHLLLATLCVKKNMEHDPWQFLNRFVIFHHNPILILDLFISGACMGGI